MDIVNVHRRWLITSPEDAWRLIANLGGKHELLWPRGWPPMRFDRPLGLGAVGGHGPIGYYVEEYRPPELIRFRFTAPKGVEGYHEFRIVPEIGGVRFRHTMRIRTRGLFTWLWLLAIQPMHDALLQDLMDRASTYSSGHEFSSRWSPWVRFLRWISGPGAALAGLARVQVETQAPGPRG
jgi:hypothetical protein